MQTCVETERLILRRITEDDADNLVELDSDPEVMRYLSGGEPTSREKIVNEVLPRILSYAGDQGFFAAIEKPTEEFLGWFHLRAKHGEPEDEPELGYRLRKIAWGKGYATEGSVALIRKAFSELGARRVHAEALAANIASRRVMEKAGLQYVRSFHVDRPGIPGSEQGIVEYELLRADWESLRRGPQALR
ncbi:GNAT family N-acetyltransferase [Streptosporangium pseudovulgare]|uniref:GNAT family acetyltransferase n=1 Tax=Streptosporangium pseudovulgare TaxID=35765 RepID=A0ABQ2RG72_9ACTN|nr:GNAT family N-acetyltransferase [Streptosporangium pseudovulgare]GGQ30593.1 GNAT family acetyltransferase [Streptosporangium pseudovulgare]